MHSFFGWLRGFGYFLWGLALVFLWVDYFRIPRRERKGKNWAKSPGVPQTFLGAVILVAVGTVGRVITS
jgi:hypothetical protein